MSISGFVFYGTFQLKDEACDSSAAFEKAFEIAPQWWIGSLALYDTALVPPMIWICGASYPFTNLLIKSWFANKCFADHSSAARDENCFHIYEVALYFQQRKQLYCLDFIFLIVHFIGVFTNQTIPFTKESKRYGLNPPPGICEYLNPSCFVLFLERIFCILQTY